jgi:hypothetical protein
VRRAQRDVCCCAWLTPAVATVQRSQAGYRFTPRLPRQTQVDGGVERPRLAAQGSTRPTHLTPNSTRSRSSPPPAVAAAATAAEPPFAAASARVGQGMSE